MDQVRSKNGLGDDRNKKRLYRSRDGEPQEAMKRTRFLVSYVVDKQIKLSDVVNYLPSDLANKTTDFYEKLLNTRFLIVITLLDEKEMKHLLESGALKLRIIDCLTKNVYDVENDEDVIKIEIIGAKDELNIYYKAKYFETLAKPNPKTTSEYEGGIMCDFIATQKELDEYLHFKKFGKKVIN